MLTILIALAAAVGLGIFLKNDPGRFVFTYAGTTVQMSFALFVIGLIIAVISFHFIFSLINGLMRLPGKINHWSSHRRSRRSEKYLTRGLMSSLEGNWLKAEEAFSEGASYSRTPMLNYLGAARAAQQQGALQRRDHYLRLAHEYSPESKLAVGLTQAELQLSQQQTEQAYATLKHLDTGGSDRDQVKVMLLQASAELQEWPEMLQLLQEFRRKKILPPEQIKAKQLEAYAGLLKHAGESSDQHKLDEEWKQIPRKLQREIYLIEVYVSERLHFPDSGGCEPILRQALRRTWDPALVRLYGLVEGSDPTKQLVVAEGLLKTHARDAVLLLTLARLCKRKGLWGMAKSYLEECIDIQPGAEAYQELASLHEQQGDNAAAAECYQRGLRLATGIRDTASVKLIENPEVENVVVAGARRVV
ncbi:MAG: heme biosynthesis HemY N-terminal domain-containing protein [Gammaproteobacteria bacterium]